MGMTNKGRSRVTDKTQSRCEYGCLFHRFQSSPFLPVQTKRDSKLNQGTAAFPLVVKVAEVMRFGTKT